jgi:hypothetical protein
MDRDAPPPTSPADALPPLSPASVRLVGIVGAGLCALAAILALIAVLIGDSSPVALNTARLFLSFVGVITAGSAISMRPDLWWSWGLASVAAGFGVVGLPSDWDSFHTLFRVLAGVAAAGAAICAASVGVRIAVASVAILFHFTGIFMACTSPDPRPWINEQVFIRVFNPYLQFVYLRNAYQFYSPNPGPASVLAFLLKTETGTDPSTGKKQYETQWVVMPKRPADVRDPLGLSYYRRLSLTEQLARVNLGFEIPADQFEKSEVSQRRFYRSLPHPDLIAIPFSPTELARSQYRLPNADVTRFVLPSYASHMILEYTPDKAAAGKTTVKVYRLEHRALTPEEFVPSKEVKRRTGGIPFGPYAPTTYGAFFLGEFDARGNLVDPQEDLLNWMIPVMPRIPGPNDPIKKTYIDYMSVHALEMTPEAVLAADEHDPQGKVFNWSQLK